ncbi:hypothetical protein TRVL_01894 [Trypanosoma vivax]|nr:hypothetical protein TRVL_01894 [Trypanosoma vivax]
MSSADCSREQRRRTLGVDCVSRLVWRHWEPGCEYVQRLRIRNVDTKRQVIQYCLPLHKTHFLMDFPEPVALSSGMSTDIEIRFRPIEFVEIHDALEVTVVGRGMFVVQLECQVPQVEIQVPSKHDFEHVAVGSTATHTILVRNVAGLSVRYVWEASHPFSITPKVGALEPFGTSELQLNFTPPEACVLVAQAVCKCIDSGTVLACMNLSGIGKYPFINASKPTSVCSLNSGVIPNAESNCGNGEVSSVGNNGLLVDFGSIFAGEKRNLEFTLSNPSLVDANFSVFMDQANGQSPFAVTPREGVIARGKEQKFRVIFTSATVGMIYIEKLSVVVRSGNTVTVQLRGIVAPSVLSVSEAFIDFGDVLLDDKGGISQEQPKKRPLRHCLQVKNHSSVGVNFYVVDTSPGGAFVVSPTRGELPPQGVARVCVKFRPTYPINYLRRLLILGNFAKDLFYVDVFGSGYNNVTRPMSFGFEDVEAFFLRHKIGLAGAEPSDLVLLHNTISAPSNPASKRTLSLNSSKLCMLRPDLMAASRRDAGSESKGVVGMRYLHAPFATDAPFYLDVDTLLFSNDYGEGAKKVSVCNKSKCVATAFWCLPDPCSYDVTPMQADVPPNSFFTFHVEKRSAGPTHANEQHLECYVNYKQMRSFRHVEPGSFTPPHFFTLCCQVILSCPQGHSGSIAPRVRAPKSVMFPPCRCNAPTHAVLELMNEDSLSVSFKAIAHVADLESKTGSDKPQQILLECNPENGLLLPHRRTPLVLTFQAPTSLRMHGELILQLNGSEKDELRVKLNGESFDPKLHIEDSSMIVLRPTCVTSETRRTLNVSNPTCLPIAFEVFPSSGLEDILQVVPTCGVLEPGKDLELSIRFSPKEAVVYEGHVNFLISDHSVPQSAPGTPASVDCSLRLHAPIKTHANMIDERVRIACPFMGEGRYAVVEVEPVVIEHEGPTSQEKTFEWTIFNSSLCEVCYEVRWLPKHCQIGVEDGDERFQCVQLSCNRAGTLAARSHTVVLVTLRPQVGVTNYILYTIVGGTGVSLGSIPHPRSLHEVQQHPHCEVRMRGTQPAIQITDVRSVQQHRSQLWCQMAINSVNAILAAPVGKLDVEKDSFAFPQYIEGLEPVYMDIGIGVLTEDEKEIMLCVENAGSCSASFRFWYPTEHEGGNESWFIDDEELDDVHHILSNRLLEIEPRRGVIPVNSHKVITITYRHSDIGTHCLPVLLRVDDGKKALLVLEGRTVAKDANVLAFHHPSLYQLHPVALGDLEPPMQSSTIRNTAAHSVEYAVQEDLVQQVSSANCGMPVFQCMNPSGIIPPGASVQLHWYFRPLEERNYNINVSLRTVGGEEYTLQFSGFGYHPKKTSNEEVCSLMSGAFLPIPISPALQLPEQLCPVALSMDVMRVGAVPCFSLHRRICYVENRHNTLTYSFEWNAVLEPGSSTVQVTPYKGVLGPGQRVRCLIAFQCGSLSQVIEAPIFCRVHNETTMDDPEISVTRLAPCVDEGPAAAALQEGTDSDFDPVLDAKTTVAKCFERPTCTKRRLPRLGKKRLPVTEIPPEYQSVRALAATAAAAGVPSVAPNACVGAYPKIKHKDVVPVIDHSLEVLVQARVIPLEEYEIVYGSRTVHKMYFPTLRRNYVDPQNLHVGSGKEMDFLKAPIDAFEAAEKVLVGLLRSVIVRPQIRTAFTVALKEEIPYYRAIVPLATHGNVGFQCVQSYEGVNSEGCATVNTPQSENSTIKPGVFCGLPPGEPKMTGNAALGNGCGSRGRLVNLIEEMLAEVTHHVVDNVSASICVAGHDAVV